MCFQAHLRRFQNLLLAGEAPPNFRHEGISGRQLNNQSGWSRWMFG
jgi:hypothetical protein